MASDVLSILTSSVVTKIVSRVRTPGNVLSRMFGFNIGGANVDQVVGRSYTYDIFDNVRDVARGRIPGTPAGTTSANPVGNVAVNLAQSSEKIMMGYDKLIMIRSIGENAGTRDRMGLKYIERQAMMLRQRQDNFREFITAGAVLNGGKYSFYRSGDDLLPSFDRTGGFITVDHQIPTNNILTGGSFSAGLPMGTGSNIITAAWSSASTDIVGNLLAISAAFMSDVGQPLKRIFLSSVTWNYVISNTAVRQVAGTAAKPFAEYKTTGTKNPDGTDAGVYTAQLVGLPQFDFVIYDGALNLHPSGGAATSTKLLPDSYCTFMIEDDKSWFQMIEGSQIVKDNDIAPAVERVGHYSWVMEKADPARFELHGTQVVGMEINVPKGLAWARVA